MLERVVALLEAQERDEPWALGTTSLALARALRVTESDLVRELRSAAADGAIAHRAGYYALPGFEPRLNAEQRAFFDERVRSDPARPLAPTAFADLSAAIRASSTQGVARAFDTLCALGELARVGESVYRREQIDAIERRTVGLLRERGRITAAEFRDLLGTSRKYAVPLLEWLDARGITRREGDFRTLAESSAP